MNEKQIQTLLMREMVVRRQHKAAIPNSRELLWHEADLITVTKAGLVHEFEIKRTMADYRREFRTKQGKHQIIKSVAYNSCPNYFWFVTLFDIDPPDYMGWIKLDPSDRYPINYKKEAPRLHGRKWGDEKVAKMARLLSFRLLSEYER